MSCTTTHTLQEQMDIYLAENTKFKDKGVKYVRPYCKPMKKETEIIVNNEEQNEQRI